MRGGMVNMRADTEGNGYVGTGNMDGYETGKYDN